ncbi:hypothetical protein GCM10022207_87370 [Streptomyces lannensis]|uniref:Uncharacterized protein n=1 Tax=Streptomyces lannensis TaxID=766498 RepID=A0ABP7LP93_9ACTN
MAVPFSGSTGAGSAKARSGAPLVGRAQDPRRDPQLEGIGAVQREDRDPVRL